MIGLSELNPRFVKRYLNLKKIIEIGVRNYSKDVKKRRFPFSKNVYKYQIG